MRDIRFRAWNADLKEMYYHQHDRKAVGSMDGASFSPNVFDMRPFIPEKLELMQYTGLKDKNGKEIYEGDVCRFKNPYVNIVSEVKWYPKTARWSIDDRDLDDTVVIGNIYENPDLLK